MPITISGSLEGNILDCPEGFLDQFNGWISFEGIGNIFSIKNPNNIGTLVASMKDGGSIKIGQNISATGMLTVHARSNGSSIEMKDNNAINGDIDIVAHEPSSISIGSECLFAHKCNISSSDYHKIFDAETRTRINTPKDVIIGNHVWVGGFVNISKGAIVGDGSVVAAGSIVTKAFKPQCVLAGVPAKVIRENIYWEF